MRAYGFEVHGITSPGPLADYFAAREDIPMHAITMPRRISPLHDLLTIVRLVRLLRRLRPTIVHAHTPKGGLLGTVSAWLARVPVRIYHIRGLPMLSASRLQRPLLWLTERVSCLLAHQVLCVSHSLRQVAVEERLCPPEKVAVLLGGSGNGVDATLRFNPASLAPGTRAHVRASYGIPEDGLVLTFVGRLARGKGMVELAEAWQRLRERYPGLHLLLVGAVDGRVPLPAATERLFREDPRVHLTGMVLEMAPLYAATDLVVLPTYHEGFPNVLLESAAMELPCVATRVPGCVDAVVEGHTGLLVPPRDPAALADALCTYLDQPALRRAHGQAARKRVLRDFRQEAIWDAIHSQYCRLLQQRRGIVPRKPSALA